MTEARERAWDYAPVAVATVAASVAVGYLRLISEQGDSPVWWVLAGLGVAASLAAYGARRRSLHRRGALALSGTVLVCLGVLGLFSIGLPLLVAGFIGLYAASSATDGNARRSVLR